MNMNFSVCMGVYRNDSAADFVTAVRSVYTHQRVRPAEVIVVVDGPIPASLESTLVSLQKEVPVMRLVRFDENRGHAAARQAGLEAASYNLVAIMDADDIAAPDRFEKQLEYFGRHSEADVVGGQISEFCGEPANIVGNRYVPESDHAIKQYLKSRCPMNLVTVMYRKDSVIAAGGFQDWYCEEDYYLWVRMALRGMTFANLPDTLVNVRVGSEMYRRRGGWRYFKSEARLQNLMLGKGLISPLRWAYNVAGRFAVQVAMPNRLRGFIFQKLFRKS